MAPKARQLGQPPVHAGGRFANGEVVYEKSFKHQGRVTLETELAAWLGLYVSRSSVAVLMRDADGLDAVLHHASNTVTLSGQNKIHMHLMWDKTSKEQWYVEAVGFSITDSLQNISASAALTRRQRILDKIDEDARRRAPPDWKVYFHLDQAGPNWLADAAEGQRLVDRMFLIGHEAAKAMVPMLKNPIGTDFSDGKVTEEMIKAVAGAFTAGRSQMSGVDDIAEKLVGRADLTEKVISNAQERDGFKLAGDAIDIGLPLAFVEAGPVSALGSTILGSFLNIAIASDAARVAKARSRLYLFFASGILSNLFQPVMERPVMPASHKPGTAARYAMEELIFQLGALHTAKFTTRQKYLVQLALLHYAATHNTTEPWHFGNDVDQGWRHPLHYTLYWSRETMLRSFTWQFSRLKYLVK